MPCAPSCATSRTQIEPEDVFLLNDPYTAGGNHLPDWVIARPVFVAGKLIAFACNRAHQADIGGGAAGTYNSAATEIFHEGIRLPVLKLIERGRLRDDLWRLLMLNTRLPEAQDGDLRAMIGSTRIGAERLAALVEELGVERAPDFFEGVLAHADRRFRGCVARLAKGVWRAEEPVDNDCFEPIDGKVAVTLTVKDDGLIVDFAGTSPQLRGFKNSSIANSTSAVFMALSSFFEPDLPKNEGAFRCVEIRLPEGTMVNARPPAPMTMNTVFIAHEIIHALWKALDQALPERASAGWSKAVHAVTAGVKDDGSRYVMYQWAGAPAGGGVEGRDGFHLIGHLITLGGLDPAQPRNLRAALSRCASIARSCAATAPAPAASAAAPAATTRSRSSPRPTTPSAAKASAPPRASAPPAAAPAWAARSRSPWPTAARSTRPSTACSATDPAPIARCRRAAAASAIRAPAIPRACCATCAMVW